MFIIKKNVVCQILSLKNLIKIFKGEQQKGISREQKYGFRNVGGCTTYIQD